MAAVTVDPRYAGAFTAARRAVDGHHPGFSADPEAPTPCGCGDDDYDTNHFVHVVLKAALESGHVVTSTAVQNLTMAINLAKRSHILGMDDVAWRRLDQACQDADA